MDVVWFSGCKLCSIRMSTFFGGRILKQLLTSHLAASVLVFLAFSVSLGWLLLIFSQPRILWREHPRGLGWIAARTYHPRERLDPLMNNSQTPEVFFRAESRDTERDTTWSMLRYGKRTCRYGRCYGMYWLCSWGSMLDATECIHCVHWNKFVPRECMDFVHLGTCSMLRDVSGGVTLVLSFSSPPSLAGTQTIDRDWRSLKCFLAIIHHYTL